MKTTIFISLIITMLLSAIFAPPSVNNSSNSKKNGGEKTALEALGLKQRKDPSEWIVPLAIFTLSLAGVLLVYFFGGK